MTINAENYNFLGNATYLCLNKDTNCTRVSLNTVFIFKENLHHGCLNLQIMSYKGVANVKTGSDSQHKSKSLAFLFNL